MNQDLIDVLWTGSLFVAPILAIPASLLLARRQPTLTILANGIVCGGLGMVILYAFNVLLGATLGQSPRPFWTVWGYGGVVSLIVAMAAVALNRLLAAPKPA
jgi:hypothetical protein